MDAVISGQAKTALLFEGDAMISFDLDSPEISMPRKEADIRFLFDGATDLRRIENTKKEIVLAELEADYNKTCVLDLALLLLDKYVDDARWDLADALEEFLVEEKWVIYLESIFYSKPLPEDADTGNASKTCRGVFTKTYNFLSNLVGNQPRIRKVSDAWDAIPLNDFGDQKARIAAKSIFVKEGIFRDLVRSCDDPAKINSAHFKIISNNAVKLLPRYVAITQQLITPFKTNLNPGEIVQEENEDYGNDEHRRHFGGINRVAVLRQVNLRKNSIVDLIRRNEITRATGEVDELVAYQEDNGERIHIIKSLCDLAQNAKELGFYQFQLAIAERATNLDYSDAWAQAQHGDALLRNGRLDEALVALENAINLPKEVNDTDTAIVAKNGYAEVLKAQGKLSEAADLYEATMEAHPGDVVARTGYAEVLKAQGKLPEAAALYEATMEAHPENVVARNGYAEVLKAQGKLSEAADLYEAIMGAHPGDVVARTGYAEVLKAQGKLPEAAALYEAIMEAHLGDVVARNGHAEILKAQGKLREAAALYEATMETHPENVVARSGYAEVLKAQGKLSEAAALYEATMEAHPGDVVARTGYAEVLKARGKLPEAAALYEATMEAHPGEVVARNGYAEVLKAQGKLSEAADLYEATMESYPENIVARNGYAGVLFAMGSFEKALKYLPAEPLMGTPNWIGYHIRGMILLKTGELDEAIGIFEKGEREDPVASSRAYFRTALAVARLEQREFVKALSLLEKVTDPLLQPQVSIFRVHAFGELKEFDKAKTAFDNYQVARKDNVIVGPWKKDEIELVSEFESRYISRRGAEKNDQWVREREIKILEMAA